MALVIVDTGVANLASVAFAFERLGVEPVISREPGVIKVADRVILPGVGAAPAAMKNINQLGLAPVLQSLEQPLMGICLGMQLLFDELTEGETITKGLGLIPDTVDTLDTGDQPSPHMGWNQLGDIADDPLLSGIHAGDYTYFVHSYAAKPSAYMIASCTYGEPFSAIVRKGNVWGCQFHPERSSRVGARILENFLKVAP